MKKRIIGIALVVAMLAIAITGGTLAYLTDEEYDKNVMVLGNVDIRQDEWERNAAGEFVAFTPNKNLYPAVSPDMVWADEGINLTDAFGANGGIQKVFVEPNAVDKFVTVTNTGHNNVYVRTLVAYERGSVTLERFDEIIAQNINNAAWKMSSVVDIVIDNDNYQVIELVYKGVNGENGVLAPEATTQNSLAQVYMQAAATNDDCAKVDGNGNGLYDILVLSQAVQSEGWTDSMTALDTAFGDVNVKNATEWFEALN